MGLGPHRHGDQRAHLQALGANPARAQPLGQRAGDDGQHDVVDGAAERVLDLLVVGQLLADHGIAAMRPDGDVERRLRRRVQTGPQQLTETLGGVAQQVQGGRRTGGGADRAGEEPGGGGDHAPRSGQHQLGRRGLGLRSPGLELLLGRRRIALEVEQHRGQVDARDAVDQRVVGLGDDREATVVQALHQPVLPQRLGAVQLLGGDPRGEQEQLLLAAGEGSAVWRTWYSRLKSGSSTHSGRPVSSGGVASFWR